MKKYLFSLTALVAFGALSGDEASVLAQQPGVPTAPAAAPQPARPRIALVNIAKVLREFNKANSDGLGITKKRQDFMLRAKPHQERLAQLAKEIPATVNPAEKEKLQNEAKGLNRILEDLQAEAQRTLGELTDHTIVDVYQCIKAVINDIAVTNNLDLVLCYPDGNSAEDDKKPAVAQMKLQTPALIPYYQRNMDITAVVILTLNQRHPAPPIPPPGAPGPGPAPGAAPVPMNPNITPAGGKQ